MIVLSSTFFGPVEWYMRLAQAEEAVIEHHDHYRKQTYRNRCVIATTQGLQTLSVPIVRPEGDLHRTPICEIRVSDHGDWRRQHWQAIKTAYGESPFFDYYADDLHPFFDRKWEWLVDFNAEICAKMCELIDIETPLTYTESYLDLATIENRQSKTEDRESRIEHRDFRDSIEPKGASGGLEFRPYWQVYAGKHGFQPNLSILDLLCNMGPEAILWLTDSKN